MSEQPDVRITAFVDERLIAEGDVVAVAREAKLEADRGDGALIRFFDDRTGRRVDLELEGTPAEVADRAELLRAVLSDRGTAEAGATPRGRGRPMLGVVAKEVTLLPRHWAWLNAQRGSASAALRRLVDEARKTSEGTDRIRKAQDSAYRFMYDAAGDAPGFEAALRALYACDAEGFEAATEPWPVDVRAYSRALAKDAFVPE